MDKEKTEYICNDRPMQSCLKVDGIIDYEVEEEV